MAGLVNSVVYLFMFLLMIIYVGLIVALVIMLVICLLLLRFCSLRCDLACCVRLVGMGFLFVLFCLSYCRSVVYTFEMYFAASVLLFGI